MKSQRLLEVLDDHAGANDSTRVSDRACPGCGHAHWMGILILIFSPLAGADDFKIIKLEQDMRNLERQVQELSRQVADLQQRSSRASTRVGSTDGRASGAQPTGTDWLVADNWKKVRPGMNEMDVISVLGLPTTLRGEPNSSERQLLYAMEIGSSGFLSGSVTLRDRKVAEVEMPTLK